MVFHVVRLHLCAPKRGGACLGWWRLGLRVKNPSKASKVTTVVSSDGSATAVWGRLESLSRYRSAVPVLVPGPTPAEESADPLREGLPLCFEGIRTMPVHKGR